MKNMNHIPKKVFILFISFILFVIQRSNGYLNLYLSVNEVQKLLGLEREVYYVTDGVLHNNALNYKIPVPSTVDSVNFNWISLANRPLPYNMNVEVSDLAALSKAEFNISMIGSIPTTLEVFSLKIKCADRVSAEVDVTLTINVTLTPTNTTLLTLTRRKICIEIDSQTNNYVLIDSLSNQSNSSNIFYFAIGCALILIAIIALCVVANYICDRKAKNDDATRSHTYLTGTPGNPPTTSTYGSFRRMPSYSLIDERTKDIQERIAELTIQRCRIRLRNVILEGTFGRVYQGSYSNEEGIEDKVIVKTVTDHASQVQISLLLQEGMSMYSLNHRNILSILGVSIEDYTAPYLLYPYQNYTNLKVFLQKCKLNAEGVAHTLTTQEVVDMALQIIQAMQYLHKKHLLHKDLAARNCVVDDNLKIQVADNALSRDLFPSDYHCLGDNENRPIKWLAIESLLHKTFSPTSDVWSFGVLLWELTTLAQQPYVEIDPFEMAAYLKDGYRLAQPINCPDELFAVMAYCWAMSADERPTFFQLQMCLQEFYEQLTKYV